MHFCSLFILNIKFKLILRISCMHTMYFDCIHFSPPSTPQETSPMLFSQFLVFFVFECFVCTSVSCACLVPMKARRGCCIPWNCSYRWLEVNMWVLKIEPMASIRVTCSLYSWAMSPAPAPCSVTHRVRLLLCVHGYKYIHWSMGKLPESITWRKTTPFPSSYLSIFESSSARAGALWNPYPY